MVNEQDIVSSKLVSAFVRPLIIGNLLFLVSFIFLYEHYVRQVHHSPWLDIACVGSAVLCYALFIYYIVRRQSFEPLLNSLKKTMVQLEEQETQLQSILNSIPDIIYYKDPDGRYLGANSAFQEYAGVYGDELEGMTDADFFPAEQVKRNQMKEMEIMCSCMLNVSEETVTFPCGITKQLEMIKVPYFDEQGGLIGLIGIGRDISERKELEESLVDAKIKAEAATKARSEFLANMSHEIRTPMNGVVTMAELICDQHLSPKAEECAVTIRDSSKILLGILNDILDFSKLDEGKLDITNEPFACKRMVRDIMALYSSRADAKGILLSYEYKGSVPLYATGDELRIRQILGNLVSNAIKFCPEGAVELEVSMRGDMWLFEVKDTGIGMTNEQAERVFEKFEQADSSIGKRFGGTGLGLAISQKLTMLMNGVISVESEPGEGTTFTVQLPLEPAAEGDVDAEVRTRHQGLRLNAHVLLADDNKYNKGAFTMFFEDKLGCMVDWAENGEIAVDKVKRNNYHMVFMDCHMPVLDGLEATRLIREFNDDIPIIALTADIMPEVREACLESGMTDFSIKPFDLAHLEQLTIKYSGADEMDVKVAGEHKVVGVIDFDSVTFEGFFGSDADTLRSTMEGFIEEADLRIRSFSKYIAGEDFTMLKEEAHGLKGAFGMVGGMKLSGQFSELQAMADTKDNYSCVQLIDRVQESYSSFRVEVEAYLDRL